MSGAERMEMEETLEGMLDRHGSADPADMVSFLLERLSEVCDAKEAHVREVWGDIVLAREWANASASLSNAAERIALGDKVPAAPRPKPV